MRSRIILLTASLLMAVTPAAFAQEQGDPNPEEIINNQIEYLSKYIEFDDIQLYYIDSTLQSDIPQLMDELSALRSGGMANTESYQTVSDKWMDHIDKAYERIFTKEQWEKYLKTSMGREKKARDKRMAKRQKK